MPKATIHYVIHTGSDGSASVSFHEDREAADLSAKIDKGSVRSAELEFDDNGKLTNPAKTKEALQQELAGLAAKFQQATVQAPAAAVPAPAAEQADLTGKVIVFTGNFVSMRRTQAQNLAIALGARVTGLVSEHTDFIVAGPGADSKLEQAQALGILVISEQQWNEKVAKARAATQQRKPGLG